MIELLAFPLYRWLEEGLAWDEVLVSRSLDNTSFRVQFRLGVVGEIEKLLDTTKHLVQPVLVLGDPQSIVRRYLEH